MSTPGRSIGPNQRLGTNPMAYGLAPMLPLRGNHVQPNGPVPSSNQRFSAQPQGPAVIVADQVTVVVQQLPVELVRQLPAQPSEPPPRPFLMGRVAPGRPFFDASRVPGPRHEPVGRPPRR